MSKSTTYKNREFKKEIVIKSLLWFAVLFLSVQIFLFSGATGTESGGMSKGITALIVSVIQGMFPEIGRETLFDFCHVAVRKTAHFSLYFLLACASFGLARNYRLNMRLSALISAGYCLLYAISDEIHQLFVPGRSGQITDVFIDFFGAVTGIAFFVWCAFYSTNEKNKKKRYF